MKTCLIPPIPDLDRFVDDSFTHHLLLAHLFAVPGLGRDYASFYQRRSLRGDYVILDNSTKELGVASHLERSLLLGGLVGAREIVLSDIRFSAFQTLEATEADLKWLVNHKDEYERAGKPALMIVPQGGSFPAWHACLTRLLLMVEEALSEVGGPDPVIGVAYAYGHRMERPFRDLVYVATAAGVPVHLLGWPRRLETLAEIAEEFPSIRSVDSSRPFVYAKHGLEIKSGVKYPGRDDAYFVDRLPLPYVKTARSNIDLFRMYARDDAATEAAA